MSTSPDTTSSSSPGGWGAAYDLGFSDFLGRKTTEAWRANKVVGARFESQSALRDFFANHTVADGRLVTGQNQNAGTETAQTMMKIASGKMVNGDSK
jgi:hypothetical protein